MLDEPGMTRVLHTAMRKVNAGADTGVSACTTEGAGLMSWSSQAIREASRVGDYGKVVKLERAIRRVSQKQLGEACGTSQSAVSRLEKRGADSYDTAQLARAAQHLQIPPHLVGLADHTAALAVKAEGADVERRNFLAGAAAVAAAPAFAAFPATRAQPADGGQAATLRVATSAFRRMDGSTASRLLVEPVLAHLRFAQGLASEAETKEQRVRLAAVGSEVAGLAAWLSWDMGDYGSARTWYGSAVKAARSAANPLLTAYQVGSLAQFEAHAGNASQALDLCRAARKQLGAGRPHIADAWLSSVEALAHAAARDEAAADAALTAAARSAEKITDDESPPWPWVFTFNDNKVAACRVSCGARLGIPRWVSGAQDSAGAVMAAGHEKQRALLALDVASGHLAGGRLDAAFGLGSRALEIGLRYKSGRIVERARALRRGYTSATPAKIVRDFDERLYGVFL
ncbi:helix-turn-helix domain-containing protein [Streptomyces platensis]|uniref:helix-turn-helix domain-containing protein n=1 Tax=Streptomyces platensis TaxID=58346 RepID=UPI002256615F|nr:helix-turn-helix domain-containing protein [Streptomyces platensis]MCX4636954.1 helix-turn-helix domain-containing protein [Streptomyces platensis]